ncbi:hypothetical protein LTR15_003607 [Elasticomyces elasticus]|nr:hypothetical protein LTR15_003607 [Elasticomyces elasticus]
MPSSIADFLSYLKASPTPYHAVQETKDRLLARGFEQLHERSDWAAQCEAGKRYFVIREASTIAAFAIGYLWKPGDPVGIIAAHTDSPCLRVKPNGKDTCHGTQRLAVEPYGAGTWPSWFDRDLGVAGRALVRSQTQLEERLFMVPGAVCRIPSLAAFLACPQTTFPIDKQAHLKPISGLVSSTKGDPMDLQLLAPAHLSSQNRRYGQLLGLVAANLGVPVGQIYEMEAILYDTQDPAIGGMNHEFIFAQRLDNLCMSYCALIGLLESLDDEPSLTTGSTVRVISLFDHEEVGSVSQNGARSDFLPSLLRRISRLSVSASQTFTSSPYEQMMACSFLISADMAHGLNPNFPEKCDDGHAPMLNGGLVIKVNANMKYATTTPGLALLRGIAEPASVPLQLFVVNNNAACGSTIGPLLAAQLGVRSADVGLAQWSMLSIRETAGVQDVAHAVNAFRAFFTRFSGC